MAADQPAEPPPDQPTHHDRSRRWALRHGIAVSTLGVAGLGVPSFAQAAAGDSPAAPALSASAGHDQPPEPTMFATDSWRARAPAEPIVVEEHTPTYIVVHHTVEPGNSADTSRERAYRISRSIQRFHMDGRGWIDTGQQFTNSRGGYITEGRHRSIEILREAARHVRGTNVANNNSQVIGIENEGDYRDEDVPDALWDSLVDLVTYMAHRYEITPHFILGHRDFNSTQCPGDVLYERLDELRAEVATRLGTSMRTRAQWPLLRPGDHDERVVTAQRLLRVNGAVDLHVDGMFGPATREAVAGLACEQGLDQPSCSGSAHADERGFLGADLWPLLITGERSAQEWKEYLAHR